MKIKYGLMAFMCLTMSLAISIHFEDAEAIQINKTIGPQGDFNTIQEAMNWVRDQPTNDYTFSVNSLYTGENYPISIDIRTSLGHQPKNIEIHGYVSQPGVYTTLSSSSKIIDICFDLGANSDLIITNFNIVVSSINNDAVYIHDSKNVEVSSCYIGGQSQNDKCANAIKVFNSHEIWINSVEVKLSWYNGIYFIDVNNHDVDESQRGISGSDIHDNENGIKIEDSSYIRSIDNNIYSNEDRGIYIIDSNHNLVTLSTMFTHEIKNNDIGIEIKGDQNICNQNDISNYDINNNTNQGIYYNNAGRENYMNENSIENVKLHNNEFGICIANSHGITVTGEYTKIFYHDSENGRGINIYSSTLIYLDFDKDNVLDIPTIHDNNHGIYIYESIEIGIEDIILKDNGYSGPSYQGEIVINDCQNFEISGFVFLNSPSTNGIYIHQCDEDGVIENVLLEGFDDSSYYGIVIDVSSDLVLEGFSDNDRATMKPLKIYDSSYITIKDIDFDRSTFSSNAVGIYVGHSDNIEMTRSEGKPRNYLNNFCVGIEIVDCYNTYSNMPIEYFTIERCTVGISISRINLEDMCFNFNLLYIETYLCDYGVELNYLRYIGAANPAVTISFSYFNNSDDYGIIMSGSELYMSSTFLYYWGDTGIYNKYYEYGQTLCGGWLHINDYCVISDPSNTYINTYGKYGAVTNTYDYIPVPVEKIIENRPYGYYWNMDSA